MTSTLKQSIREDMKSAMRAKEAIRLGTIRMLMAAIKQREIDEQITLDDSDIFKTINKMIKQRRDSVEQFQKAERQELVEQEVAEIDVLIGYLPAQLSDNEVQATISAVIQETQATSMRDMGAVMAQLKSQLEGQADMGKVSKWVKEKLAS